jgi:hypothetical protein
MYGLPEDIISPDYSFRANGQIVTFAYIVAMLVDRKEIWAFGVRPDVLVVRESDDVVAHLSVSSVEMGWFIHSITHTQPGSRVGVEVCLEPGSLEVRVRIVPTVAIEWSLLGEIVERTHRVREERND